LLPLRFAAAAFYKKLSDFRESIKLKQSATNRQKPQNEVFQENLYEKVEKIERERKRLEDSLSQTATRAYKSPGRNANSSRKVQSS
jgi:hypothetical protein